MLSVKSIYLWMKGLYLYIVSFMLDNVKNEIVIRFQTDILETIGQSLCNKNYAYGKFMNLQ